MNIKQITSLFLGSLALSASAFAGHLSMTIGDYRRLPDCGGSVEVTKSYSEQVNLVFKNVEDCSNFDILSVNGDRLDYDNKKLGGYDRNRSGSFTLPKFLFENGRNTIRVVLKSNSGKTSDMINVRVVLNGGGGNDDFETIKMSLNDWARLSNCGGSVETKRTYRRGSERLVLSFNNVKNCSNFDILGANGERVDYDNQKLDGYDNNRYGSFVIPSHLVDYGRNSILVVLKSNSGKTSNKIRINFRAY